MMVEETDAIMVLPTCAFVKPKSALIVGISGARPNHPKKHTKNISHVIWKVLIWIPFIENIFKSESGNELFVCIKNRLSIDNYFAKKSGLILICR